MEKKNFFVNAHFLYNNLVNTVFLIVDRMFDINKHLEVFFYYSSSNNEEN
jgi:hypothetical protein